MTTGRIYLESIRKGWMRTVFYLILVLPFLIGFSLFIKSWPLFSEVAIYDIVFGMEWMPGQGKFGLWPFIYNSILIACAGMLLLIPVSLAASLYITQFAPLWISKFLRSVIDILAGMPSVIFGLWGVITIVPAVAIWAETAGAENTSGYSILAAAVVMCVSVMPFVLNMLIELFQSVAIELKETALSLGASHWQTIKDVIVKKTRSGIIAAFTLGASKAFGETIAILMVVGNIVQIPDSLFGAGYPLPALLANNYGEMMSIPLYDAALMFAAFLLLAIVVIFNTLAHWLISYYQSKN